MGIGKILGDLVGKGSGNLVESLSNVADKFIRTKEEKDAFMLEVEKETNRHNEVLLNAATKELELQLADTANARDTNAKIQESEHASWLAKNVGYVIDLTLLTAFIAMLIVVIYKQVPESNKELFFTGFGALGAYLGTSIQFHRGTTAGSNAKQKHIEKLTNKLQ